MSDKKKGKRISPQTEFKKGEKPINFIGRTIDRDGYVLIYSPNHPFRNSGNNVREHRLVMEAHIGRYLTKEEVVHHRGIKYPINSIENKQDNRIENLQLFENNIKHMNYHRTL